MRNSKAAGTWRPREVTNAIRKALRDVDGSWHSTGDFDIAVKIALDQSVLSLCDGPPATFLGEMPRVRQKEVALRSSRRTNKTSFLPLYHWPTNTFTTAASCHESSLCSHGDAYDTIAFVFSRFPQ